MKKDRNAEVARALKDGQCQHPKAVESTDQATGNLFCGDCGATTVPWAQQTPKQQATYRFHFGHSPEGAQS